MTLERGALLHKRYRIVEILGQGGMGSVYRAVDENLGVDVAVKENLFTTDEYARQFRLEAVILANLRHPNLPRVTDHFVIGDQGQYLVMDYIEGEDLRQRMERMGNITEDDAILMGAAMCDALTYLHTRKPPILHRDIKPGNVKITPDGHIFLVDFGLAKVLHGSQATTTGARAMTPGYSPPEQYGTARTDPRTDIYSLGATIYAALSGIIPEDGLARAMDNTQLTPLRKRNSKVSRRLASAIEKAMGIDPADRFQNAEEFKRALLGSKSKTQRLPGDYVIPAPPPDANGDQKQNAIEKESQPLANLQPLSKNDAVLKEAPVFKPKRRRRKGRRILASVLLVLFFLSLAIVSAARFMPTLLPTEIMGFLAPISSIPIPFLSSTSTPTSLPESTATQPVVETSTIAPTVEPATPTQTLAPTATPTPILEMTSTADSTPIAQATLMGGGHGQVAFASLRAGKPQIYLVGLDKTNLVQLTQMENGACQPSWSPDGSQLVFTSPCRGRGDFLNGSYSDASLYVMNEDGTGIKQLTNVPGADFDPDWSPDGEKIAFTSIRDGNKQIYTVDLESLAVTRLSTLDVNVENSQPAWSPDGEEIAYLVKRVGTYQVWVMSNTGQDNVQIARSGQSLWDFLPNWSSDGKIILFSQRRGDAGNPRPWLMSIQYEEGGAATRLDHFPTPIEDVEYSPDGTLLLFEGMDNDGNRDIYFMTITGGGRTRLTDDPAVDFDPAWRPLQNP